MSNFPSSINNRNTRTNCEICSKLTIKTPCSTVSVVTFGQVNVMWVPELNWATTLDYSIKQVNPILNVRFEQKTHHVKLL